MNGIGGSALPKVVANAPKGKPIFATDVFANSSDKDVVSIVTVARHRLNTLLQIVHDLNSRCGIKQLSRFLDRDGFLCFD